MTPEFLAALAQVEGSGNPIVRTYWRWSWKPEPFEMYRPASSAVGMYQITDGTFEEAKRFCIHDHVVVEDGPWNDWDSCWFNGLYFRVVPSHAVEMTSAYLDRGVARLKRHGIRSATLRQKQNLATLMHLCGLGAGNLYAKRRFHLAPGQRCGDHSAAGYLAKVESMRRVFARLAAMEPRQCQSTLTNLDSQRAGPREPLDIEPGAPAQTEADAQLRVVSAVLEYHSMSDTPRPT